MTIRTKILLSHAIMAAVVALVAVVIITILRIGGHNQREVQTSYEQIRAINLIAVSANDYSEQVAELFVLGTDPAEIEEAHAQLLAALERKARLIEEEHLGSDDPEEAAQELRRIDLTGDLLTQLEVLRRRVAALLAEGRRPEAEQLYHDQIEHRLDDALGALIDFATENERREVDEAIASSARLAERLRIIAWAMVGGMILLALGNSVMLHRALLGPVAALAAAADAVGRGDLSHHVEPRRRDELGNLAARFNMMTRQIREQHARLVNARSELERQVAERTRELRHRGEELETANARLREVDAGRSQFLADISHELRTPLTILRGQAEVTLRARDDDPRRLRETLGLVVGKADQMGRLVEDLLFLARTEAGTIAVERAPLVLQDVIADVLLDSQGLARREGVTISPRQPAEPVVIEGDASRLRQAIVIPLDNALKVAPPGSQVRLELCADATDASIRISDEGPGFTPEEAQRAFIRFFRGSASRGRAGRGAGLGLAIARWIVDQHGGTIDIASRPGEGATVRIDLPLREPA